MKQLLIDEKVTEFDVRGGSLVNLEASRWTQSGRERVGDQVLSHTLLYSSVRRIKASHKRTRWADAHNRKPTLRAIGEC